MQLKKHNKNEHFIFPLKKKTYKEKTNGLIAKGDLVNVYKSIFLKTNMNINGKLTLTLSSHHSVNSRCNFLFTFMINTHILWTYV